MHEKKDTILALSTPPGKSAIALIRISGVLSHRLVKKISTNMPNKANTSLLNKIKNINGEVIDQTITTFYKAPKSFTGEDMVEISTHGSRAVIKELIRTLTFKNKARLAVPGEFTRRAFENNKLDLTQVEAVADIVNAETEIQRKQAINQLSGCFFKHSKKIFEGLKKILANIEATIDFSDEDLPEGLFIEIKEQIENNINEIKKILKSANKGISIREGFIISVIGKPNTGKSSFINNISGKEVSIVTNQPGTTRDLVESFIDLGGLPIKFIDTAGIRKPTNLVEKIGIKKAHLISKTSDLNMVFIENIDDIKDFNDIKNPIFIKSKQDLSEEYFRGVGHYNISSKNNYGIDMLVEIIKKKIYNFSPKENTYVSRERHVKCLEKTIYYLERSRKNKSIDLFAEDVRQALKSFTNIFGNVDIEDILDIIFSDFCIGK